MTPAADVLIRPYRLDDAPDVCRAVRESITAVMPWMPWCHPEYSIGESRAWLEVQVPAFERGTAYEFAITAGDGRYLGGCGLNQIDRPNQRANLGYWVRTTAAGRGAATAAVKLVRDWGFQNAGLNRLEVVAAVGNLASRRVAEKAGAIHEGTLRGRLLLYGVFHDAAVYSFVAGRSV
jgi:ribosomal-protein-serine acetyltransferase